jgi:hypothetical protein
MSILNHRLEVPTAQSPHGGQLLFCARGLEPAVLGEYSENLDWIDVLTPSAAKKHFIRQFIASQCAFNGRILVAKLFPAKLAKFMLAGYASLAEEVLWANGAERTARIARGMRVGWFVLLYAPLMLWGLWRLARRVGDLCTAWLVLPVALFGVAVMFAGETSPRYSMPVQALLLMAGACGWVGGWKSAEEDVDASVLHHPFATGMALLLVTYGAFAAVLLGSRSVWRRHALADMRTAELESGHPAEDARQAPFVAVFPDGQGEVKWPGDGGSGGVYLYGNSWREHARIEVEWRPGEKHEVELPSRLELDWAESGLRHLIFRRMEGTGPLHLGYAEIRPSASDGN